MKVVFFQRRPEDGHFSVERFFDDARKGMPSGVESVVAVSRYFSRGIFRRLYNIFEAAFRQGDINHVTGDVHFLTYLLSRRKTLLTILDCVSLETSSGLKRALLLFFWYTIPVKRAGLIAVISSETKAQLLKWVKCDPNKVRVVPVCVSPAFQPKAKPFNKECPIILQIGTRHNKNIDRLIEALAGIPCRLDTVGNLSSAQKAVLEKHQIRYTNSRNLSDDELIAKYEQCDMVSFVSTYEGFGMPIVEANAVGRPVVTSQVTSMPEVAGDAACLVDPFSVPSIRSGILRVIADDEYRNRLIQDGFLNALKYRPKAVASHFVTLYYELLRRGSL